MTEKIHVLYITAQGNVMGGGEVSLLNLLKHLNRERFKPLVVLPSSGSLFQAIREMKLETQIIALKPLKKLHLFSFIQATAKLFCLVKKEKIDIIHSNAAASRESIYSALVAKLARKPFIYHARVLESSKAIEKFLAGFSTRIIAISEKVKDKFSFVKDKNKMIKIFNAVDLAEFNPDIKRGEKIRAEFGISSKEKIVGTVGRLYPLKGIDVFLKAAAMAKRRIAKIKFLIVGEDTSSGAYRKKLERQAEELGVKSEVIFTGFRADIPELIAAMDLFVLPSFEGYEAFGRVVIEAMAMSKPVVATRGGGVPEIVEDGVTGVLVSPGDTEPMAEAVVSLLKNEDRAKQMGFEGRQKAKRIYDLKTQLERIENLYLHLLRRDQSSEKRL
jgi:glycosyltransferase involved in cell wall biosynthesis